MPVLLEVGAGRRRPATVLAAAKAKEVERLIRKVDGEATVAARGRICVVGVEADDRAGERATTIVGLAAATGPVAVTVVPGEYRRIAEALGPLLDLVLLLPPEQPSSGDRALTELARVEATEFAGKVEVVSTRPGRLAYRRALAGALTGRDRAGRPIEAEVGSGWRDRLRARLAGESGQATPLVLGAVFALVVGAVVLVAIAGAITGKARGQSAADLSALSAVRSMKQDLPRLLAPPTLPSGLPNPAHMPKAVYLARARFTAIRIATSNGASALTVSVRFPDALSYAPVTAKVSIRVTEAGSGPDRGLGRGERRSTGHDGLGARFCVSGGGYSGPLAERLGHGMRPDVAAAFDRLSASAADAGVTVVINSAFRSDTEQAALFAANPDPTWVARPGTSLHRCGTELDLGPTSSYSWLAANAGRFGFVRRYSWEPWHFGFEAGPAPCSRAGDRFSGAADRSRILPASVPGFVPARFRPPILSAAMKWGVSAALLSAQLLADRTSTLRPSLQRERRASPSSCPARRQPTVCETPSIRSRRSMLRPG